ncbi:MAG: hypothetical protein AUI36_27125, partial [Cyanobacteria bacterium 13_1_40CM_2_61_4]
TQASGWPRSLIEHWNGSAWKVVPAPHAGFADSLKAVAAVSPTDIWAVGYFQEDGLDVGMIFTVHWDGGRWSEVPNEQPPTYSSVFNAVVANSADDVWAVGDWYDIDREAVLTLAEHWDGTAWTISPTPNTGDFDNVLNGLDSTSSTDAWAAGTWWDGTKTQTLTLHWDGAAWTVVPSPNFGSGRNVLFAVDSLAPDDVWTVGGYYDDVNTTRTLVLRWDGLAWGEVPSPDLGDSATMLAVSALGAEDIWAAGSMVHAFGETSRSLTEHWDGSAWRRTPSPSPGGPTALFGASALSAWNAWAVGGAYDDSTGQFRTLILHCCR